MTSVNFDGIEIFTGGIQNVPFYLKESFKLNKAIKLHLCNAYTLSLSKENKELYHALKGADLNLPDGRPLAWCISLRRNIQVRGMNLFEVIILDAEFRSKKHLFFGIAPEKRSKLVQRLGDLFDHSDQFEVVEVPYVAFENLNYEKLNEFVESFKPDFVWIGLGTPKQDLAVEVVAQLIKYPCVIIPVGAVFDFIIGQSNQAPELLSKLGFEWLFRWVREPRRLASRYTKYNFVFLFQVLRFLLKRLKF